MRKAIIVCIDQVTIASRPNSLPSHLFHPNSYPEANLECDPTLC
jgi:hypothetical protein